MFLDLDWQPSFGEIITWFAMDKNGLVAIMVNNCFGKLPKVLLQVSELEGKLDRLNEYMWEESSGVVSYPENKGGLAILDLYSICRFGGDKSRKEVELIIAQRSAFDKKLLECSIPSIKGFYVYHAVEGSVQGEDYPVGYSGKTEMGDYFRYLMPTVYASIDDFPEELRGVVVVSDVLDFTSDQIVRSCEVDSIFNRLYS